MNFFKEIKIHLGINKNFEFSIEIYKSVCDRIYKSVSTSRIEEGGKFLGNITEHGNLISIKVYSYLDAGPNVENSSIHIRPDGEHQHKLFRLIEGFDPNIEHIGSWHSHHSNGLEELSGGDIKGYFENVNAPNYNLDWFFVMLITKVKLKDFEAKYYLFHRTEPSYYSVSDHQIKFSNNEYPWDNILKEVEQSTYIYRNQTRGDERNLNSSQLNLKGEDDIRANDHSWLKKTYPNVQAMRNKRDNTLSWRWIVPVKQTSLEITYKHLSLTHEKIKQAALSIKYNGDEILTDEIDLLDELRYQKIGALIKVAKDLIEKTK